MAGLATMPLACICRSESHFPSGCGQGRCQTDTGELLEYLNGVLGDLLISYM